MPATPRLIGALGALPKAPALVPAWQTKGLLHQPFGEVKRGSPAGREASTIRRFFVLMPSPFYALDASVEQALMPATPRLIGAFGTRPEAPARVPAWQTKGLLHRPRSQHNPSILCAHAISSFGFPRRLCASAVKSQFPL
jgi:hypothetical protein